MSNNTQFLYEQMPTVQYNTYGIKKTAGIKIIAGIATIAPNNTIWASKTVEFGSFFSAGCRPIIVTGIQPTGNKSNWRAVFKGIGTYYPDNRGAVFFAGADYLGTTAKNVVDQTVYVHYIAIGW